MHLKKSGKFFLFKNRGIVENETVTHEVYIRPFPKKEQIIRELRGFIERGIKLFYIYSGGVPVYYNYANQFYDMFKSVDFKGLVSHHYIEEADHTYMIISVRERLKGIITEWVQRSFP